MADNYDITQHHVDAETRGGLTTEQAEDLHSPQKFGYNELPVVEVSKLWMFVFQFMGTMPYMLEVAAIVSAAAADWADFGILLGMLLANGVLGFHEELKCLESLVRLSNVVVCTKMFMFLLAILTFLLTLFRTSCYLPLLTTMLFSLLGRADGEDGGQGDGAARWCWKGDADARVGAGGCNSVAGRLERARGCVLD